MPNVTYFIEILIEIEVQGFIREMRKRTFPQGNILVFFFIVIFFRLIIFKQQVRKNLSRNSPENDYLHVSIKFSDSNFFLLVYQFDLKNRCWVLLRILFPIDIVFSQLNVILVRLFRTVRKESG